MSVTETISNRIKHMPKGKPFAGALFATLGTRASVDKALSRLVHRGALERVTRGVYMRPKQSQFTGKNVLPSPIAVMEVVAKARGETIQIHGAEAVRRLGLSTQVQVLPTYYTSGSTREIRIGQGVVRLRHASRQRLQLAGTTAGSAFIAMLYLGREGLSHAVSKKVVSSLSREDLAKLMSCKMPAWMRTALQTAAEESGCQLHTSS
ncbi:DUF6088 family protein [Pseudomonas aeruginosa]|jgi:hypothetical protein|uniref:DUF6088 family protein n=1 Tax=Pseudomonas aeruginosa TaxID=287 RepID=UPI00106A1682|nr:DUF6088 family protein [Pseudomonas aeruginosa]